MMTSRQEALLNAAKALSGNEFRLVSHSARGREATKGLALSGEKKKRAPTKADARTSNAYFG